VTKQKKDPAMITGIQDFYYNVKDMAEAVRFYEALGLKKEFGDEYWTAMTIAGFKLGLHGSEGKAVPPTPRDAHGQHCGGTLTFRSDGIAADKKKIESAGGRILGEADAPWGQMLVFEDPDGNLLKLMKPKH
jgi:predicted enzyme related to lactoylglutathione lyase